MKFRHLLLRYNLNKSSGLIFKLQSEYKLGKIPNIFYECILSDLFEIKKCSYNSSMIKSATFYLMNIFTTYIFTSLQK